MSKKPNFVEINFVQITAMDNSLVQILLPVQVKTNDILAALVENNIVHTAYAI